MIAAPRIAMPARAFRRSLGVRASVEMQEGLRSVAKPPCEFESRGVRGPPLSNALPFLQDPHCGPDRAIL